MRRIIGVLLVLVGSACGTLDGAVRRTDVFDSAMAGVSMTELGGVTLGERLGASRGAECRRHGRVQWIGSCLEASSGVTTSIQLDESDAIEAIRFVHHDPRATTADLCERFELELRALEKKWGTPALFMRAVCEPNPADGYGACAVWKAGGTRFALSIDSDLMHGLRRTLELEVGRQGAFGLTCFDGK